MMGFFQVGKSVFDGCDSSVKDVFDVLSMVAYLF